MNSIRIKNRPMFAIKVDPLFHHSLCFVAVEKARAAIAGLHSCTEIIRECQVVVIEMLAQWLDSRCRSAATVLNQRNEHPAHAGCFLPCSIVNILPRMNQLL